MQRSLLILLLGVSVTLATAACGAPDDAIDEAFVDVFDAPCTGKCDGLQSGSVFIHENDPFYWQTSTYDELVTADALAFGYPTNPVLDDSSSLTKRTQAWLDKIDGLVRADVMARTGRALVAPRPIAKVIPSNRQFNAWVSGVPTCLHRPFRQGGAANTLAYLGWNAIERLDAAGAAACVAPAGFDDGRFASFWNATRPGCRLTVGAASVDVTGYACDAAVGTAAERLVYASTSPYIHVTTDLIAASTEPTFVTTLAHELGHYYRAHTTDKAYVRYNYWYRRDPRQKSQPLASYDATSLAAAYAEVTDPNRTPQRFSSRYSARLRPFLLTTLAPLLQERAEPTFGCKSARASLGAWTDEVLSAEIPTQAAQRSLRKFEDALASCASRLTLDAAGSASSLPASTVLFGAAQQRPGGKTAIVMKPHETLATFLSRLDTSARALDQKAELLRSRINQNGVGLYTTEQEADDLSLLLSTRLGITPDEVIEGWLQTMQTLDDQIAASGDAQLANDYYNVRGEKTASACRALYQQRFEKVGATGKREPVLVALGDLNEPHHATCYRVFNLYQQTLAHAYRVAPRATVSGPSWEAIQGIAQAISASATQ